MRARRVDKNHSEIVAAFRKLGFKVKDASHVGDGFPDLVIAKFGRTGLVEVKDGSKSKSRTELTPDQVDFLSTWPGRWWIVKSLADVEQIAEKF